MLSIMGRDTREVERREEQCHQPYVARLHGEVVAYGWSAAATASIGGLDITLTMPPRNQYLWDFVTLPQCRGRGIYPRLLQSILLAESETERFWIGHDFENIASARGIIKAGFQQVGRLHYLRGGGMGLIPDDSIDRAADAAVLLGVPLVFTR